MFTYLFGVLTGMVIGAMFAPVIMKWVNKAKSAGKELHTDIKDQYNKKSQ